MSSFAEIPDAVRVLCDYLYAHAAVVALGARVATKAPDTHVDPWVRVAQLDATDYSGVEHSIDFLVQFDCFAGDTAMRAHDGPAEAIALGRTVRAALKNAQGQTLDGVVVSKVVITGDLDGTDFAASEPARDRRILTASISAHA